MGRSSSKLVETPNNPLQELQYKESKREKQKRKQQKELRQIAKLQKKHAKKDKKSNKRISAGDQQRGSLRRSNAGTAKNGSGSSSSMRYEITRDDFNRQIEQRIKTHLDNDLCMFIMNQISLTTQFCANYDNEIATISDELLQQEIEFNKNLDEHSIMLANPLDAMAAKWIKFNSVDGPDKGNPHLLQAPTMYVVFENIDIARPNDANYDSISPLCKVDMDTEFHKTTPCKEDFVELLRDIKWKGYVRLKLREDPNVGRPYNRPGDDVYTDTSSSYSTTGSKAWSVTSSGYESDYDCDYVYIQHLNTHHPMAELRMRNEREKRQLDANVLPESCVSSLGGFMDACHESDTDDESDEDDEDGASDCSSAVEDDHSTLSKYRDRETIEALKLTRLIQERRRVLLQQRYLNSNDFMRYFGELMRQRLTQQLPLSPEELEAGTYRGCSIHTQHYEIIPAIHVAQNAQSWPDCAFQFRIRERPIATNPLTGQKFQWPTRSMIKRIETFGFHVIPIGFVPKRQRNPFRELEWRIVFPKAERYLERHLAGTQVKVFMLTKALLRTFVEGQEKCKALMFAMDHLRTHLFWECERNFTAWPEEFLGEVLLRFIASFMQCLSEKRLRDFFIEGRNLFESIPEYSLVTLYSVLAEITQNPLMHLMGAFRNLQFAENFYPKLNFKKIFNNLAENDLVRLRAMAKNARSLVDADTTEDEPLPATDEGAKGLVGLKQHREKTNGKLRRKTHLMRHNIEMKKKQDSEAKRPSVEFTSIEFVFTKNQGIENLRRTNLLEVWLDHLLPMTEKAIEMGSTHVARLYLAQARRLCRFYHNYGCDMSAKEYLTTMQSIAEDIEMLRQSNSCSFTPPALPIRTSVEPVPVKPYQMKEPQSPARTAGNLYVEIPTQEDAPRPRRSYKLRLYDSPVQERKELTAVVDVQRSTFTPESRKSIKLTQGVIEVQEGDSNPIQKPEGSSTVGILRFGGVTFQANPPTNNNLSEGDDDIESETCAGNSNLGAAAGESSVDVASTPDAAAIPTPKTTSLMSKFGSAAGILKSTPTVGNSKLMQTLATSTKKALNNMSAEEKIREMIRSVQLRGAFNQSSDT